jgi:hypothetical protein
MKNLPPELWLHIAHYIGVPDISKYLAVHRTFYEFWMDEWYKEVALVEPWPVDLFKSVGRLRYVLLYFLQ